MLAFRLKSQVWLCDTDIETTAAAAPYTILAYNAQISPNNSVSYALM